jgi:hypothetical protein
MPIRIACPGCQAALSMPESMYGKSVKCPKCQTAFQCPPAPVAQPAPVARGAAPPPPPPPPPPPAPPVSRSPFDFDAPPATAPAPVRASRRDDEYYDDDYDRRPRRRRSGWEKVKSGFLFLYISAGCFYLCYLLFFILSLAMDPKRPSEGLVTTILILGSVAILAGAVLGSLGLLMGTAVPGESGAKAVVFASMISMMVGAVLSLVWTVMVIIAISGKEGFPKAALLVAILMVSSLLAACLLHLFAVSFKAISLQNHLLKGNAVAFAVLFIVLPSVIVGLAVFAQLLPLSAPPPRGGAYSGGPSGGFGGGPGVGFGGGPGGSFDDLGAPKESSKLSLGTILFFIYATGSLVWYILLLVFLNASINRARRRGAI